MLRCAMQGQQRGVQERRREGGTRERGTGRKRSLGLFVAKQQGLGQQGDEVEGGVLWRADVMKRSYAVARGKDINRAVCSALRCVWFV